MKFAKIDFIEKLEEIPLKFNLYKNEKILNWYIKKFTPYIKEDLEILNTTGYKVKLPILKKIAYEEEELLAELYLKTISSIKQLGVEIVDVPFDFKHKLYSEITVTNKQILFISFILNTILKSIKIINKSLKDIQIVILDDKVENSHLTNMIVEEIYESINYLTLITEKDYTQLLQEIFQDNGLNIAQVKSSNSIMSTADIIINVSNEDFKNYHILKSGSVFIDISNNIKSTLNVCIKREDILVIDNLNINFESKVYSLEDFELAYYVNSKTYRNAKRGNDTLYIKMINEELDELNVTINSFKRLNKTLTGVYYTRLKQKINNFDL